MKYKYVDVVPSPADKRLKPLAPSAHVMHALAGWLQVHLYSLDCLTGGNRLARFQEDPSILSRLQPMIADGLIQAIAVRNPEKTFSLFTWLDNGGLVMDWMISSMEAVPLETERVKVGHMSINDMATRLGLSRTHLARKLKEAEDLGSLGWEGKRGNSVMWVSRGFREEYATAQAAKLSIIDHACDAIWGAEMSERTEQLLLYAVGE